MGDPRNTTSFKHKSSAPDAPTDTTNGSPSKKQNTSTSSKSTIDDFFMVLSQEC
jgi:hypothetical protein